MNWPPSPPSPRTGQTTPIARQTGGRAIGVGEGELNIPGRPALSGEQGPDPDGWLRRSLK